MHIDPKRELVQKRSGQLGMAGLVIIVAIAVFAPLLATHDPLAQTVHSLQPPSFEHLLGTNQAGQDIWSQLVYGARTSLVVGLVAAVLGTLLSVIIGASAALVGGLYDRIVMRIVDAFLVIPLLIVLILLSVYLGYSLSGGGLLAIQIIVAAILVLFAVYMVRSLGVWGLIVVLPFAALAVLSRDLLAGTGGLIVLLALFGWQGGARIIRSQTLSLKERGHVTAARGFGGGWGYVLRRHLLPDLGSLLVVDFVYCVRRAVFLQAGLAFLGLGDPNIVSWGTVISDAFDWVTYENTWLWWLLPVGLALSLTIVSITLIGQALETVLDPRLKGEADA
jgi:peptide/nickel transport system permease protein